MKFKFVQAAMLNDSTLLYPLQCSSGIWEWYRGDNEDVYDSHYALDYNLFINLPGYGPDKFCIGYPSLEDAYKALLEAISKYSNQQEE